MPKTTDHELEMWITEQFSMIGINPRGNYYPRGAFQHKLIKAHPVKSDIMTKAIANVTARLWPKLLQYETPAEQERLIRSAYSQGGKRHKAAGGGFVGMDEFRNAVLQFAQISRTKPKHNAKRQLVDELLVQYERQLLSGDFGSQPPNYTGVPVEFTAPVGNYGQADVVKHEQEFAPSSWDIQLPPIAATGTADAWEIPEMPATAAGVCVQPSIWDWAEQGNVTTNVELNGKPNSLPILEGSIGIHSVLQTHFHRRSPVPVNEIDLLLDYPELPSLEEQHVLLNDEGDTKEPTSAFSNSVILSAELLRTMEGRRSVGQYSLLGTLRQSAHQGLDGNLTPPQQENRLFLNTNIPTSFFICGLQGSGKSHTLSCLLENYLIPSNRLGVLRSPLSALVLHYDPFSTKQAFRPCEAVFLAGVDPTFATTPCIRSVTVLVSPSNYHSMRAAYGQIPHVAVRALRLRPRDLTCGSMQALMSIDQSQAVPLYMSQVVRILRTMSAESGLFDYRDFKRRLQDQRFKGAQKEMLDQRLSLLESFLNLDYQGAQEPLVEDAPGTLTIVDLSCPFVNQDMACVLFNVCVELYLSSPKATGKVIAVDEAHKYMADTPGARVLTQQLLAIIRLQRHCNTRVVIATQEPTVSPLLIGLTSVKIIHHFSSVDWYKALDKHLPQRSGEDPDSCKRTHFDQIAQLQRGEAVVFDPSAILGGRIATNRDQLGLQGLIPLGNNINHSTVPTYTGASVYDRCFAVKIRKRMTLDGGRSIVCIDEEH